MKLFIEIEVDSEPFEGDNFPKEVTRILAEVGDCVGRCGKKQGMRAVKNAKGETVGGFRLTGNEVRLVVA